MRAAAVDSKCESEAVRKSGDWDRASLEKKRIPTHAAENRQENINSVVHKTKKKPRGSKRVKGGVALAGQEGLAKTAPSENDRNGGAVN